MKLYPLPSQRPEPVELREPEEDDDGPIDTDDSWAAHLAWRLRAAKLEAGSALDWRLRHECKQRL